MNAICKRFIGPHMGRVVLLAGISLFIFCLSAVSGVSNKSLLEPLIRPEHVDSLDSFVENFEPNGFVFGRVCMLLNQPCGCESLPKDYPELSKGKTFQLKSTTPRKVLDEFIRQHPKYHWLVKDDVLIFEPKKRRGEDLLARKLNHVVLHDVSTIKAARIVLKQADIKVFEMYVGPPRHFARINLELKDVTVREVLNAIAKADNQAMWCFSSDDKKKGHGSFAMSAWRKSGGVVE